MAVGNTAGQLTWKPAGVTTRKHIVGCMAAAMFVFAIALGAQTFWLP